MAMVHYYWTLIAVIILLATTQIHVTGRPVDQQTSTGAVSVQGRKDDLQYALIPLLIGMNAVDVVTNLAQASADLKVIWQAAVVELTEILRQCKSNYHYEIYEIIDDAVANAQFIMSPVLKSLSIILNLLSSVKSMTGISTVMEIVDEQIQRLVHKVEEAAGQFDELFQITGVQLAQATEQIGMNLKNDVLGLVHRTIQQMKDAMNPMMNSLEHIIGDAKTQDLMTTMGLVSDILLRPD